MYAIIEMPGNQYRVAEGDTIKTEKLDGNTGDTVDIDKVLLISADDNVTTGKPYVEGASVKLSIVKTAKDKKVDVFKMKTRKGFRRLRGHRQNYTLLKVDSIITGSSS